MPIVTKIQYSVAMPCDFEPSGYFLASDLNSNRADAIDYFVWKHGRFILDFYPDPIPSRRVARSREHLAIRNKIWRLGKGQGCKTVSVTLTWDTSA